ncbi:M48 family metalloprotease [Stakelama saccharophila]|uniref:M48 family metalloprotease n=1 Tax=Stakelama saccharophila TaxID=3075605 RepID=A0ABZ0BBL2_9SPHN|nr:M48 family metalloprotease [Stakelama sp. W311]WNO54233.1 M48 family metalloprotease [Stakelama sp. W311]
MKRIIAALAFCCLLFALPVRAQTILRDTETEALLKDMSRPIIEAAGLSPKNVEIIIIQDKGINAFVAGGQVVFLHSGLIEAADNANQVQGVIAHELGHIVGGHVPLADRGAKSATGISIGSLLLGVAAMAAGAGDAGMGILAAGQRAALGRYLAFSRTQEASADAAGADYLDRAHISGKGMLAFFKKLQNYEYRIGVPQDDSFNRSHPLTGERIAALTNDLHKSSAWGKSTPPGLEQRFELVQAKLEGYVEDKNTVLRDYPETTNSLPAHYARAYAYHRAGYPDRADAEAEALVSAEPENPYFLELKGQILLESGRPEQALDPLRKAVALSDHAPMIGTTLGHALVATENPDHLKEAESVLRQAIARDDENPFAWLQLGTVYERKGDAARAALASAERANLTGDPMLALVSARAAVAGLPKDTPDRLRAQDIVMVSKNQVDEMDHGRRRGS